MSQLETKRLVLHPYTAKDLDAAVALYGDPKVTQFTKLGRLSRAQSRAVLDEHLRHWREKGFGMRAMVLKSSGDFAGECGFFTLESSGEAALRYALLPPYWGQGLTSEAVLATIEDAFGSLGLQRIVSVVEGPNHASHRIMEKLGLRVERTARVPKTTIFIYAITLNEWVAAARQN